MKIPMDNTCINPKTYLFWWMIIFYSHFCCIFGVTSVEIKIQPHSQTWILGMEEMDNLTVWFSYGDGVVNLPIDIYNTRNKKNVIEDYKFPLEELSKHKWHKMDIKRTKKALNNGKFIVIIESLSECWHSKERHHKDVVLRITASPNIWLTTSDPSELECTEKGHILTYAFVSVAVVLLISLLIHCWKYFRHSRAPSCTHQRGTVQPSPEMVLADIRRENGFRNETNQQEAEAIYEEIDDHVLIQENIRPKLPPPRQISAHSSDNSLYDVVLT